MTVARRCVRSSSDSVNSLARSVRLLLASRCGSPRPLFIPSLPVGDQVSQIGRGSGRAVEMLQHDLVDVEGQVGADEVGILQRPSTARRRPKLALTTVSTVSASAMPSATMAIASRHSACCRRLPTKPGDVLLDVHRRLADRREQRRSSRRWPPARSSACRTTSTSGTRKGGFHQWVPRMRSRGRQALDDLGRSG